jgi:squalene-hopene/tetraprenyl-beta-curcumene cyclase
VDDAFAYLDKRAEEWKQHIETQRPDGTSCISCHSMLPYLLASPLVGREPAAIEDLLRQDVETRAQNWSDVEPWVSSEDGTKDKQALGTESIINAAVLSAADAQRKRDELSPVARKAFDNLWALQKADGGWDWMDYQLEPWESTEGKYNGAALVAIAVGIAPGDYAGEASVRDNLTALGQYIHEAHATKSLNLHSQVFILWASTKLSGVLNPAEQSELAERILDSQNADGGWSLASLVGREPADLKSDGYATGLVVYVLKQAGKAGEIQKGLQWLAENQNEKGYWPATSVNQNLTEQDSFSNKFMWDASTAFAVLALSEPM